MTTHDLRPGEALWLRTDAGLVRLTLEWRIRRKRVGLGVEAPASVGVMRAEMVPLLAEVVNGQDATPRPE